MNKEIILITGASRGIGAATAILAAQKGYAVCINYHSNKIEAESVVRQIKALNVPAIAVAADVSNESSVVELFNTIDKQLGTITALVNNVGIADLETQVENMTAERINKIFSVNVTSYFLCAREAIKRMSTKHEGIGGNIINVSSTAAKYGSANRYVDYAASKAAIDTFTKGLSLEVAEQGIRVNAVRPGFVYTDFHENSGQADRVNLVKNKIPLKRGAQPEEIAAAIMWLLSNEASYVTGTLLDVSGGR